MVTIPVLPQAGDEVLAPWGQQVAELLKRLADPKFMQSGQATVTGPGNAQAATFTITFPVPFANPPAVLAVQSTLTGVTMLTSVGNVTATNFQLMVEHDSSTTWTNARGIQWLAVDLAYLRAP